MSLRSQASGTPVAWVALSLPSKVHDRNCAVDRRETKMLQPMQRRDWVDVAVGAAKALGLLELEVPQLPATCWTTTR